MDSTMVTQAVADTLAAVAAAPVEAGPTISDVLFTTNNLWMMVSTALVFWMNLGFGCVESGLTRAKNTTNIMFKNTITPVIGIILYAAWGFNVMYPGADYAGGFFGFAGFGLSTGPEGLTSAYNPGYTYWTDFLFQVMFAATAATIVSGAVAERIKLSSYIVFTFFILGVIYPIAGFWKWGNGWLNTMEIPFYDFAGSTIVHSIGGWAALAGVIVLGPRIGKYVGGKTIPIPGHSMPLATIGVFVLWLGWFGFNGGSVLSADPGAVSRTLMTTTIAAAAGGFAAMIVSWFMFKKPDLSMTLNGILAGLVAITAGADKMLPMSSILIGAIGGVLAVYAVIIFDKLKLDDPVGALSVHLVNGVWGTLAVGLFGDLAGTGQVVSQLIGIAAVGAFTFTLSLIAFYLIKVTMGLRVSADEEFEGLDIGEHGMEAYPDFANENK